MQELVRGEFWLKISIGGREVFAVNNQLPTEFPNVKVNFYSAKFLVYLQTLQESQILWLKVIVII